MTMVNNASQNKIKEYISIVEKVAKIEHRRIPAHMVDYDELVSIGIIAVQSMIKNKTDEQLEKYNSSYIGTAVRWAIRNELRNRYKWYTLKNSRRNAVEDDGENNVREEVYKTILSIEEMQEAEVPTQIKAEDKTPEESLEFVELKAHIIESMKKLPRRERELIEYKFFKEKKLREIAEEFDISQSRISRIIQAGLDKIKKDLKKQGII